MPRLVVCWMLTPDDLDDGFRAIDPPLFDGLSDLLSTGPEAPETWSYGRQRAGL